MIANDLSGRNTMPSCAADKVLCLEERVAEDSW